MSESLVSNANSKAASRRKHGNSAKCPAPWKCGPPPPPTTLSCCLSRKAGHLARLAEVSDVYRTVLGPTSDETILAGLQTVMEMCLTPKYSAESQSDYSMETNYSGSENDKSGKPTPCMIGGRCNQRCMSVQVQSAVRQDSRFTMTDEGKQKGGRARSLQSNASKGSRLHKGLQKSHSETAISTTDSFRGAAVGVMASPDQRSKSIGTASRRSTIQEPIRDNASIGQSVQCDVISYEDVPVPSSERRSSKDSRRISIKSSNRSLNDAILYDEANERRVSQDSRRLSTNDRMSFDGSGRVIMEPTERRNTNYSRRISINDPRKSLNDAVLYEETPEALEELLMEQRLSQDSRRASTKKSMKCSESCAEAAARRNSDYSRRISIKEPNADDLSNERRISQDSRQISLRDPSEMSKDPSFYEDAPECPEAYPDERRMSQDSRRTSQSVQAAVYSQEGRPSTSAAYSGTVGSFSSAKRPSIQSAGADENFPGETRRSTRGSLCPSAENDEEGCPQDCSGGKVCEVNECYCLDIEASTDEDKDNAAGGAPEEVKYAIARISRFQDYSVFEILKPTRAKPRNIPKQTEGVFVLKNNRQIEG